MRPEAKKYIKSLYRTPPLFEDRTGKVCRLDRNERTTPFPEEHLQEILEGITADELVAYPELEPFYQKLAQWLGVKREEILLTSGAEGGIRTVYEVYVEEGDEVLIVSPTYAMFAVYAQMFGAMAREVYYNEDFSLPLERILQAINAKTKLVAVANPNHTGTVISEAGLLEVIRQAEQSNALVLLDEAYHHFYEGTLLPYIRQFDNLVIIRSFSKAFGIAPLRVGYVVSNKNIIDELYKVKLTYEITAFSARVGMYLLDHLEIMKEYVQEVHEGKRLLYQRLPAFGFEVLFSEANFVFFKPPHGVDGKHILSELEGKKIFLKGPFTKIPFNDHYRITVGSPQQMDFLCQTIQEVLVKLK